jgi:hypothetical protein
VPTTKNFRLAFRLRSCLVTIAASRLVSMFCLHTNYMLGGKAYIPKNGQGGKEIY